jgi:hypothetical protein
MPRVFILNRGPHDYSDARRFGELTYCTDGSLDKDDLAQMYRELEPFIVLDSRPEDFILLTSLTSLCSIACAMFAARHGRLNLLIYRGDGYVAKTIYFKDVLTQANE